MATRDGVQEALVTQYCLVLERRDLREIYTRLDTEGDWHRLSQRIYVLNKTAGRKAGVRFILHRDKGTVKVYFESPERLQALLKVLREGRGFVQKSLCEALERKASQAVDRRSVPKRLRESQTALLKEMLARDLGLFASADLDSVLVDASGEASQAGGARPEGAPKPPRDAGAPRGVLPQLASLLPGSALVLGESGSGKTALLYAVLRDWDRLGPGVAGISPVYVSAKHLHFSWGRFDIPWAALPGVEPNMVERLEAAFEEGRLALLIDGINENPAATDFTNPAVQSFWKTAGRNCCVLTSTPRFYESNVKVSPLRAFFPAGLGEVALAAWGTALYKALFERLARALEAANPQMRLLAGYLGKLSVEDWQRTSGLLRLTPLTGLACANFFASHQGERLPKDEYELMEHMTSFHLRHESFKGHALSAPETALGLLMRLAWQAYVEGQGGKFSCVSTDNAARVIRECYPMLDDRKADVFHFLSQLPQLDYSPENGLFYMNQHFADYLVARYILQTFLSGDTRRLREVLGIHWEYLHVSRYYFQGLAHLSRADKAQYFSVVQGLVEAQRQEARSVKPGEGDSGGGVILARLLQPLGFVDLPEASEYLWSVFNETREAADAAPAGVSYASELVLMSAAIGLAWGGDPKGLEAYVERMRRVPRAAEFNLNWYLFYRRHDRFRRDIENFKPAVIGKWDSVCDWLLGAMNNPDRDFYPLRLLYAYSLANFLKAMGPAPFAARPEDNGAGQAKAAERVKLLERVLGSWPRDPQLKASAALGRQFQELAGLLARHKIKARGA